MNGAKVYAGFAADKATAAANKIVGRQEIGRKKKDEEGLARVVAVDWALSKERWQEAAKEGGGIDEDEESVLKIYDGDEEEGSAADEDASMQSTEDSDSDEDGDGEIGVYTGEPGEKHQGGPPPPEEGTTLFIRNVPFEATDDDLKEL